MPAPSFCACLTEEFMNTVQREPRSMGCFANRPSLQEFLDGVTHRAGERFDERAAAGRARLVERDVVDALVADFEALDVLTADVDDKINIRAEVPRRAECATVSTRPKSTPKAFWMSASP